MSMLTFEEAVGQVKRDGYCLLRAVYDKATMKEAREKVEWWNERCKDSVSDDVPYLNVNQLSLYSPHVKDVFFLRLLFEPQIVEDILIHFMNDRWFKQIPADKPNYILRSLVARSTNKITPMHIDSFIPYLSEHVLIMQYSIILEDQTTDNGCTVVVPGSHLSGEYTTQEAFKDAVPIESEAGDVVMWDSRLWHGTPENHTEGTRWALIATFCRWWIKQHFNTTQTLPQEIYEQLSDSQKAVLGFCSIPHRDETEGIDLKRGYGSLLPDVRGYRTA